VAAAARRFAIIVGSIVGGTAALSLLLGLALGSTVSRALSVGFYIIGCVMLVSGFFVGNRGPARPEGEGWSPFSMRRWVRWATPDEQRDTLSLSAVLVVVGFLLIALGVLADTRYKVV
jgi:sugar phosphate permease